MRAGETGEGYYERLKKAELVRTGHHKSVPCYPRMRYVVMQAVQQLEKTGYYTEVCSLPEQEAIAVRSAESRPALVVHMRLCWHGRTLRANHAQHEEVC